MRGRTVIFAVIFNYLIGNCDAHGKNFSFLYADNVKLAPLYDLISTIYYKDLATTMAMKLGNEDDINRISIKNFEEFAKHVGLSKTGIRRRIFEIIDKIISSLPAIQINHPVQQEVRNLIKPEA